MAISRLMMNLISLCNRPVLHITRGAIVGCTDTGISFGSTDSAKHYDLKWTQEALCTEHFENAIIKKGQILSASDKVYAILTPTDTWVEPMDSVSASLPHPTLCGFECNTLAAIMARIAWDVKEAGLIIGLDAMTIDTEEVSLTVSRKNIVRLPPHSLAIDYYIHPVYGQLGYAIGHEETYQYHRYIGTIADKRAYTLNVPPLSNIRGYWNGDISPWKILGNFLLKYKSLGELYITNDTIAARSDKKAIYIKEV